jgi:hypothetical protein
MQRPLGLACALLCFALPVSADLIGTTGQITVIPPPPSVAIGALESNTTLHLFVEKTTFTLLSAVAVNISAPGYYGEPLTPGTVPAGACVDSTYIHSDKVGAAGSAEFHGVVTFDTDVLGIIVRQPQFNNSNPQLGAPGTVYPASENAWDVGPPCPPQDSLSLDPTRRVLTVCSTVYGVSDDLRVITQCRKPVGIDIKPGSFPNSINLGSMGRIPVTQINVITVKFGQASPVHAAFEDVNGDGALDMILQFPTQATGIPSTATMACVKGNLFDGTPFKGCDSVNIVP